MRNTLNTILIILFYIIVSFNASLSGQIPKSISGTIIDADSHEPIPSATIVLSNYPDSVFISGTTSHINGDFMFGNQLLDEKYILRISYVGYNTFYKNLASDTLNDKNCIGKVLLHPDVSEMNEFVVTDERIQAATGNNKSIFYINKRIGEASNTGLDVIKFIPGVHVDFMQNIIFEGNRNVLIMVDGRARDMDFLRQLNAKNIDRIEISRMPDSGYEATVSGIIHIFMKEPQTGISGHINAEIPSSPAEVYVFPGYSINYGGRNMNLFTSYSGSVANMDIRENTLRQSEGAENITQIDYVQHVRQKNWSHRFNYGLDWYANKKSQLNYFGFINPYSREHDGQAFFQSTDNCGADGMWTARKEDTDKNMIVFNSLYYKYAFSPKSELSLDLSHYSLRADNMTEFFTDSLTGLFRDRPDMLRTVSHQTPMQNTGIFKLDYSHVPAGRFQISAGVRGSLKNMKDGLDNRFNYREQLLASYVSAGYTASTFNIGIGMRVEQAVNGLTGSFKNRSFEWLPFMNAGYQLTPAQNIQLSYRQMVQRPTLYQLNPVKTSGDPFLIQAGNPELRHTLTRLMSLEYSLRTQNNYYAVRLFNTYATDAIGLLTSFSGHMLYETLFYNLGDIQQYGVQFNGALRMGKSVTLNPFIKLFEISTTPGEMAAHHSILSRHEKGCEVGISAILSLPYEFSFSLQGQYISPLTGIQNLAYSDALYFLAINKSFGRQFRIGLTSALPFARSFIYQGTKVEGANFFTQSQGNVLMSYIPLWFTFSYRFSAGKTINRIRRTSEDVDRLPGKGF